MSLIELPFPPSSLSGHNKGEYFGKNAIVQKHRTWAHLATLEEPRAVPDQGDIRIVIRFYPPDHRGDRVNFPNRMKPYIDGIADGLGVNDKRFLPSYEFFPPEKPGRVVVEVLP